MVLGIQKTPSKRPKYLPRNRLINSRLSGRRSAVRIENRQYLISFVRRGLKTLRREEKTRWRRNTKCFFFPAVRSGAAQIQCSCYEIGAFALHQTSLFIANSIRSATWRHRRRRVNISRVGTSTSGLRKLAELFFDRVHLGPKNRTVFPRILVGHPIV
jgi:hypothetical protein